MTGNDDTYFIEKVKKGDPEAFRYLVDRYKDMVYSVALGIVRNPEDAEELAQDAFVKAYKSLKSFKAKSKFSTWLYRIVYNMSISHTRKKTTLKIEIKEDLLSENDIFETFEEFKENSLIEKKIQINKALKGLNDLDQMLVKLFYIEDFSVKEIHKITNLSNSNIKVRLYRARNKLYNTLKENRNIVYEC